MPSTSSPMCTRDVSATRDVAEVVRPIRLKTFVTPTTERTVPIVHCPQQDLTINAQICAGCMRMRSLEWEPERGGEVHCLSSNQPITPDGRADMGEVALRTHVADV